MIARAISSSGRLSIAHLFFTEEREEQIKSIIAEIQENKLDAKAARHLSAPFMSGYEFHRQTPDQLSRHFGAQFVQSWRKQAPLQISGWGRFVRFTDCTMFG